MKVCVLSSASFEINYSSYHLMRDLIESILNDGNEVKLIQKRIHKKDYLPDELKDRPKLTVTSIHFSAVEKSKLKKRMLSEMKYYLNAAKAIYQSKDCDVFFLQSNNVPWLPVGMIRALTHKQIIYNVQDIFPQNAIYSTLLQEKSLVSRVLLTLQRWALKHSAAVITVSEDMKQTLMKAGAEEKKVFVAYNWANNVRRGSSSNIKLNDEKYHVVYAGNIGRMQNVEVIVRAAAKIKNHPEIQFDIYGNGASKEKCKKLADELGADNIHFCDPVPADEAYALYENADLNIVPLAKNIIKTALPSKTAVCLSCGKPLIFCIDAESCFAAVLREHGICVLDSEQADELSEKILEFLKHPPTVRSMTLEKSEALKIYNAVLQNVNK